MSHMHPYRQKFIILIAAAACFTGCRRQPKAPDVSHIPIQVHIAPFHRDFFSLDTTDLQKSLATLHKQYPVFLPVYITNILGYGPYADSSRMVQSAIRGLLSSPDVISLEKTVEQRFPDMDFAEKELTLGFRYIKYYLPSFHPPRVVTFLSGLNNYGAVTADSVLGIGLDMFLGGDFPLYKKLADPYPDYMLRQFSPAFMAADCFRAIHQQLFPFQADGQTLLAQMIYRGKQLYFLDKVMPGAADSIKIGYTGQQLKWCRDNEQLIWQYFVQRNLLYSHDWQQIMHYIGPAPTTEDMPSDAPGDIGSWIGWQIVRKYMEEHPHVTLKDLLGQNDAQALLNEAHYRPH